MKAKLMFLLLVLFLSTLNTSCFKQKEAEPEDTNECGVWYIPMSKEKSYTDISVEHPFPIYEESVENGYHLYTFKFDLEEDICVISPVTFTITVDQAQNQIKPIWLRAYAKFYYKDILNPYKATIPLTEAEGIWSTGDPWEIIAKPYCEEYTSSDITIFIDFLVPIGEEDIVENWRYLMGMTNQVYIGAVFQGFGETKK